MGKVQKVVWPQGRNAKPIPRRLAPKQAIPMGKSPAQLALQSSRQLQAMETMVALPMEPPELLEFNRNWLAESHLQFMEVCRQRMMDLTGLPASMLQGATTSAEPCRPMTALEALELQRLLEKLAETPAPSGEPITVTEAQYQALRALPMAETLEELLTKAAIFGTAVMVVPAEKVLDGEILPPETEEDREEKMYLMLTWGRRPESW
ncbi:Hypothetical protein NGAL_HAMBI2605_59300 [Neorhizobium galegae bv. orientalis]|nr:Hypothetical protein NGAL_HAMBI2605_59300 [Neorhizobium galegae bv. orientalis]